VDAEAVTELLGVCSYLLLPVIGCGVLRLRAVQRTAFDGRIGIATASGALIVAVVMSLMSLAGLHWTSTRLFSIFALIALVSAVWVRYGRLQAVAVRRPISAPVVAIALFLTIAGYAALSARMTCVDISFFWAPKGVDFFRSGGIDVSFLRAPDYFFMHSDYPPLLPLIYAWSNAVSRQFAWFAAVLSSVLFLACIVGVIRSTSHDDHGSLLVAAILSYVFALNYTGGCADPLLLLFEAITLVALTFLEPDHSQTVLAAIGMAGAVWTKVEGAAFVVAVVLAMVVLRREIGRAVLMALPSVVLLVGWIAFASHNAILDAYGGPRRGLYFAAIPKTIALLARHARLDALWLPWIVLIVVVAIGPNRNRAALPLLVAVLNLGSLVYFYIHDPDPTFWIETSANRTLLPPLLALCVAAVAAQAPLPESRPLHENPELL
jgi:hypothetical protein